MTGDAVPTNSGRTFRSDFAVAGLALIFFFVGLIFPDVPGNDSRNVIAPTGWAVAEDPGATLKVEDVAAGALDFRESHVKRMSLKASDAVFWLRIRVDNHEATPVTRWLTVGIARLHEVSFFEQNEGVWRAHHSGMAHPFTERDVPTITPVFVLDLPAGSSREVLVRVASETLLLIQPRLWAPHDFIAAEAAETRQEFFGAGVAMLALLVGVLLAVILREMSFMLFGMMVVAYLLFRWSASGLAFAELWPDSPGWALRSIPVFLAVLGLLLTLLHRHLLETRRRLPRADRVLRILGIGFSILVVAALIEPNRHVILALMTWGLLLSVFSPVLGYLAWRHGTPLFGYFLASYVLPWHLIELQYFASMGWLPRASGWLIGYNRAWALILVATVVLIALGTRIRQLLRAREQQLAALEITVAQRTAEMREARELAEEALADQRRLLAMASHEFRAPLANIGAAAQLLGLDCQSDKRDVVERITRATSRLKHFLDNCLTEERLAPGGRALHESRIALPLLLRETVDNMRCLSPAHTLYLTLEAATPDAHGDAQLVRVLLNNLLENAIKYSPKGSVIEVSAQCRGDGALSVSVQDQGPGIAAGDLHNIFHKFYRSDRVGNIPGTGLGLYVAQHVARLHGGEIEVHSLHGHGARFTFVLPRERVCA